MVLITSIERFKNSKKSAIEYSLKILGDLWNIRIIYVLSNGRLRFNEIQRQNKGISPSILADRLKRLENLGFIKRTALTSGKISVSYSLTEKGKGVTPILQEMYKFAKKYT